MSTGGGDWSWGPEPRAQPPTSPLVAVLLAVVIAALLATGAVAVLVHHRATKTVAPVTPAGYQRVVDTTNGISLAVPAGWRVLPITTGQLSSSIQALKAAEPQMSAPLDLALAGLSSVRPGVFAIDVATRTTLLAYGVNAPRVHTLSDISVADVMGPFQSLGAQGVQAAGIHLPIGPAERISVQLPVGGVTVTELLDYFVVRGRLVVVVVASRGAQPSTAVFHQIEASLAAP